VYVERGHRHGGVGRLALEALIAEAGGAASSSWSVASSPRTWLAWCSTARWASARWRSITATASSTASGGIAPSSRSCWAKRPRPEPLALRRCNLAPARGPRGKSRRRGGQPCYSRAAAASRLPAPSAPLRHSPGSCVGSGRTQDGDRRWPGRRRTPASRGVRGPRRGWSPSGPASRLRAGRPSSTSPRVSPAT
jgi:hypothetical protein